MNKLERKKIESEIKNLLGKVRQTNNEWLIKKYEVKFSILLKNIDEPNIKQKVGGVKGMMIREGIR